MLYRTLLVCGLIALIVVPASVIAAGPMGGSAESGKLMGQNLVGSGSGQGSSGQATAGDQTINRFGFTLDTSGKGTMLQTRICDMECLQNQTAQDGGSDSGSLNQANRFGFSLETAGKGTMLQTRSLDAQSARDLIRNQTRLQDGSCGNCINS
ncbi:hypothetical protein J2741_001766 [Methanolinea mesophila]|uniref:hypothetical protein n=1 Tax=Methanolinea mesophila TaxID=547055 RepID=UPI001AE82208|nr:hypothetical protein [Methanolinea mesophila]MBP1929219.1 hypothetical protein [Methanolinea mesophila]